MNNKIVVIGSAGHAKVVIDIIERENRFTIVGLLDKKEKMNTTLYGYKVLGEEADLPDIIETHAVYGGIVAIGDNNIRARVVEKIKGLIPDFNFITAIHPSANIGKNVKIGVGTVIIAGTSVNSDASIGEHCILNTNSSLGHEATMHDFSSISPNVAIGGGSEIGKASMIAISATLIQGIKIGANTMIGAGSLVVKDIPDNAMALGSPCRIIRKRNPRENFF